MANEPQTVEDYLARLPEERRTTLQAVRDVILANLPEGYQEGIQYGMIGYYVPHEVYPQGYHCDPNQPVPFASLASQKNHMAIYLMGIYGNAEEEKWLRQAWAKTGKKLDMGKSCLRFKRLDDLPLPVLGQAIRRMPVRQLLAHYDAMLGDRARGGTKKRTTRKKTARKKAASKRKTAPRAAAKRSAEKQQRSREP